MDAKKLESALLRPVWSFHDVMDYMGCKETKARRLIRLCRAKYGGATPVNTSSVLRDSFLSMMNTSTEKEARNIALVNEAKRKAEETGWRNQA